MKFGKFWLFNSKFRFFVVKLTKQEDNLTPFNNLTSDLVHFEMKFGKCWLFHSKFTIFVAKLTKKEYNLTHLNNLTSDLAHFEIKCRYFFEFVCHFFRFPYPHPHGGTIWWFAPPPYFAMRGALPLAPPSPGTPLHAWWMFLIICVTVSDPKYTIMG